MTSQFIHFTKRSAPLLAALILAGCVSYSGITPHATLTTTSDMTLTDTPTQWPSERSWEILHDPVLSGLIEQALANNPNIKIAQARLDQVSAMASEADANR